MTADNVVRIRSILALALQLPVNVRLSFVQAECGSNKQVFNEVEELLRLSESAGEFLNTPIPESFGAAAHVRQLLAPGSILKRRYWIETLVSKGGFATVYVAKDREVADKTVTVKVLDRVFGGPAIQTTVRSELLSLSHLRHQNLVGISDTGELEDGTPFLVLTYVPGVTLRELIQTGPLPRTRSRAIIKGIGRALIAAHNAGVLHLDIKPENVIVSDAGTDSEHVTVIDFGIAQLKNLPGAPLSAGSPRYMAPEQNESPSERSDIYSLALVSFELFYGRLPDFRKHLPLRGFRKALDADPLKRFSSVEEFTKAVCTLPAFQPWVRYTIGASAGFLACLGIWFADSQRPSGQIHSKPIPLVTTPGTNYRATFSPDGEWVYYVAGPPNQLDIYKKSISGGEPVRVVDNPAIDDEPKVSPDGRTLAFIRGFPLQRALILKELEGRGTERELGRSVEFSSLSWAADGQTIAVARFQGIEGGTEILSVNIKTSEWKQLVRLKPGVLADDNPTVSPSGGQLAFVRKWYQGSADLFVVDVDSSLQPRTEPRQLTNTGERIDAVQWTPDGQGIVYLAGPLGRGSLWRIPASGGARVAVLPDLNRFESIAISPKAARLAFSVHRSDSDIWRLSLVEHGSQKLTRVITGTYDDEEPRLSPDGRHIAFSSGRSGDEQIWVADADGGNTRQVTSFASPDSVSALWTLDSDDLIVSVRSKELGERIFKASVEDAIKVTRTYEAGCCNGPIARWTIPLFVPAVDEPPGNLAH